MLNRLLDGFTGTLTTKKWAVMAKSSHDTALRDIQSLIGLAGLVGMKRTDRDHTSIRTDSGVSSTGR